MTWCDPRLPGPIRRGWHASLVIGAAYFALVGAEWLTGAHVLPFEAHKALQFLLVLSATVLVLARGVTIAEARATWMLIGFGLAAWMAGKLVTALQMPAESRREFGAPVDVGLLIQYVAQYAGLLLLARTGLRRASRSAWLDGAIAVLLLGAIAAQLLLAPLLEAGGTVPGVALTIAYPVADAVLLSLAIGVVALHGGRPGGIWWIIAGGLTLNMTGDAVIAMRTADGTPPAFEAGPLALVFILGGASMVAAAMRRPSRTRGSALVGWRSMVGALVGAVLVLALMFYDVLFELAPVPEILLATAVACICLRSGLAFYENGRLADSHRQAMTDELTGLPNRRSAYAELDARCLAERGVAVLMIDLDRFKDLNDTLGHHAGDEALVAVAAQLSGATRDRGHLSRLGGDEFLVVLGEGAGLHDALAVGRRVLDALDKPLRVAGLELPMRASIGVACIEPRQRSRREDLLRRADIAMYDAKSHTSGIEVYSPQRDEHSRDRLALAADLQDAITGGQLVLHFQPKASLRTGAVVGVEALVRWMHPARGLVPPAEFVPLVERSGLGRLLTLEVTAQALGAQRRWRDAGLHVPVAVNVSADTLLDMRFPDDVATLLRREEAPAGSLSLELTEETIMTDPERAQDVLARLSELGIELSLDDFGTGYSSLSMLKRLPVRELKIDRSFVMGLLDDAENAAIVRSTVDLARNLGLRVVAEGVESAEAWDLLAEWGCDLAQGYHLSRPVPEPDLLALLRAPVS